MKNSLFWLLPSRHKVLEWSPSDPGCSSPSTSSPRLSRQLSGFLLSWMAGHLDPGERRIGIKMTTQKCRWAKFYGEKNKTSVGVSDRWTALTMFSTFFSRFCLAWILFDKNTYAAVEVVFAYDLLDPLGGGPDKGCGVQVVQLVEVEEGREISEHLVPDPVSGLVALLDLVDDVVADLGVLANAEDVVTLDSGGIPHQEHAALPLRHQQVSGVLPRHRTEVPAEMRK